jgi:hypothetical protein
MQRRKGELGDPGASSAVLMTPEGTTAGAALSSSAATGSSASTVPNSTSSINANATGVTLRSKRVPGSRATFNLTLNVILLSIAVLVAFVFLFPSHAVDQRSIDIPPGKTVQDFQRKSSQKHRSQEEIEHELRQRIVKQPPKAVVEDRRMSKEATEAMARQPSSWVDGEKKLKQKLKVLYERQQKGLELGVPILTRYVGEDIPAWVGPGVDEKEWRAKVDAKYEEMKEEEKKWIEEMKKIIEKEPPIPY